MAGVAKQRHLSSRWPYLTTLLGCALLLLGCAASHKNPKKPKIDRNKPKIVGFEIDGNEKISDQDIFKRLQSGLPPRFTLKRNPRFDDLTFETDLQRIEALYRSMGYYDAKVIEHKETPSGKNKIKLWVSLEEGEPVRIEDVKIIFPEGEPNELLRGFVTGENGSVPFPKEARLIKGNIFESEVFDKAREELSTRLIRRGYAQVKLTAKAEVDKLNRKAYITFTIDPGPKCTFGEVHFDGLPSSTRLDANDLNKYLAFNTGEPFNLEKVTATQQSLFNTGAFATVDVEPDFSKGGSRIDINIRLEEVKRHRIQAGGGAEIDANSRFNLRGRFSWLDRNIAGGLSTLQISVSGGSSISIVDDTSTTSTTDKTLSLAPVFNLTGAFALPSVGSPYRSFVATTGFAIESPSDGLSTGTIPLHLGFNQDILGARKAREIKNGIFEDPSKLSVKAFSYGYGNTFQFVTLCFIAPYDPAQGLTSLCADNGELNAVDNAALQSLGLAGNNQSFVLNYLEQYITYNRTDDPSNPRKGYALSFNVHEGAQLIPPSSGGASGFGLLPYLRILPEGRAYIPLNEKRTVVFATRLQLGFLVLKDEKNNSSPFPERFFLGGANSHRAFAFQGLSPISGDIATGGNALLFSSSELRFDTPIGIRWVDFFDLGAVPQQVTDIPNSLILNDNNGITDVTRLQAAIGTGLRYVYGPLIFRADVAAKVYQLNEIGGAITNSNTVDVNDNPVSNSVFSFLKFQISIGEAF